MLKPEDNERLVRVGPGTPAGTLMRRYWQAALLADELPERDGPPVRVRLLCEDLIAFRDTNGRIGLVEAYCPHRRAALFFGRNEECGLRCAYHGWKFDVDGNCVDMPSEPAGAPMKDKVRLQSYPTVERGGVVWAYLGPREQMPAPPDFEWTRAPSTHAFVSKTYEECNYLQALEGGLDTSHASFAHNNYLGNKKVLRNIDTAPRIEVETTDYGYRYISTRNTGEDQRYVRVYHYVMPNQQMRGAFESWFTHKDDKDVHRVAKSDGHIWVPIDDEHTFVYNWTCGRDQSVPLTPDFVAEWETHAGRGKDDLMPGSYKPRRNRSNDYLIDRQVQKTRTFTGIKGVNTQDFALQEGMGPIVDRSKEHLGSSDKAIVTMRRLLLDAIRAVERGEKPPGLDPHSHRHIRPYDAVITGDAPWQEAFATELVAKW
ncbi:MAG: phthalate 4,5-dioxygenase [Alphaproteobacteria bacterium]|jgi:phenylpropionate dioxygenase-like ring-hydroxylating dioxygenase large terminal subunit|nr:phthalate 4,5-dioxygenase [Alphaproteobacteria bacterium]